MAEEELERPIRDPFEMPDIMAGTRNVVKEVIDQMIRDHINKMKNNNPSDHTVVNQRSYIDAFRRGVQSTAAAISPKKSALRSNIANTSNLNLVRTKGTELLTNQSTSDRERDKVSTSVGLQENSSVSKSVGVDQEKQNHDQEAEKVTTDTQKDAEKILKEIITETDKIAMGNPGAAVSSEQESTTAATNNKDANRRTDVITLDKAGQHDKELSMDPVDDKKLKELKREEETVAPQTEKMSEKLAIGNTRAAVSSKQESTIAVGNVDTEGNKRTDEIILKKYQELILNEEMVERLQTDKMMMKKKANKAPAEVAYKPNMKETLKKLNAHKKRNNRSVRKLLVVKVALEANNDDKRFKAWVGTVAAMVILAVIAYHCSI